MRRIGQWITDHPVIVLVVILLITLGAILEMTLNPMEEKFDNEDFMPDLEVTEAWTDYQEVFTPNYSFVVLVKDGDGDLFTKQDFLDIIDLSDNLTEDDTFIEWQADSMGMANPDSPPQSLFTLSNVVGQVEGIKQAGSLYSSMMEPVFDLGSPSDNLSIDLSNTNISENVRINNIVNTFQPFIDDVLVYMDNNGSEGGSGNSSGNHSGTGNKGNSSENPLRNFVSSMDSDSVLKDKITEVLSYDITDPAIFNATFISGSFMYASMSVIDDLNNASASIGDILKKDFNNVNSSLGMNASTRQMLLGLRNDINTTIDGLEDYKQMSAMSANPSVVGYVMQAYNMASFSLIHYVTEDFVLEDSTPSAKGCLIMMSMNHTLNFLTSDDPDKLYEIEMNLTELIEDADDNSDLAIHSLGGEILNRRINEASMDSMMILLPLAFLLIVLILFAVYRSFWDIIINIIGLVLAVIWMYGFGSLMGFNSNPMLTAVPVLIVGLGIDYGIHLTMRYREEIKKGERVKPAITTMIASVGVALVLATFTTVLAFLSNIVSPVGILAQFGAMAAFGIFSSFVIMLTFLSAIKRIIDLPKAKKGKNLWAKYKEGVVVSDNRASGIIRRFADRITSVSVVMGKKPILVLVIIVLITGGMGYAARKNEVTFDVNDFLPDGLQESKDINYLMNQFALFSEGFSGQGDLGIIIVEGDITDPDVLEGMMDIVDQAGDSDSGLIKKEKEGSNRPKVSFVLYSIKDMAINEGSIDPDSDFYNRYQEVFDVDTALPKDTASNSDIKDVFDMFLDKYGPLARTVLFREGKEYTKASMSFTVITKEHSEKWDLYDELKDISKPLKDLDEDETKSVKVTGTSILTAVIVDSISASQQNSLIITILVSLVVLTIVFFIEKRSLVLGAVATVPVVFCMLWILGTMQLLGIPLNVLTITVAALTVGLGITYGIHMTHRFIEDIDNNDDVLKALAVTAKNTGFALMGAAFTTIGGFGLLMFALLPPLKQFGQITALAILFSFLSSVTVLPAFLVLWVRGRNWWQNRKTGNNTTDKIPNE